MMIMIGVGVVVMRENAAWGTLMMIMARNVMTITETNTECNEGEEERDGRKAKCFGQ